MARPTKQGIDYFPLDVQFDDKIDLYLIEKESTGLAVMITLWQLIYQNEGYYISNSNDLHLLIKRRINVSINEINDCINAMLTRGIFDKRLHDKHGILTSKAIQKRYFDAAKRKKEIKVIWDFMVIRLDSCENIVNVDINGIINNNNATNVNVDVNVNVNVKEKKKDFLSDSTEYGLAEFLFTEILKNNPDHKKPNLQAWAKHIDLMIRIDKRKPDDIRRVIVWAQNDSFWKSNILSTEKLRTKFDALRIKMGEDKQIDKDPYANAQGGSYGRTHGSTKAFRREAEEPQPRSDGEPYPIDEEF